ncbi:hypothetical protein AVEN_68709-1 [Araneus ventricosus]|uniref:Uncharacterized protein n=1 Tax=Araneus ventricosus TaxID=182803 RepID=A0A4Y2RT62_ARAVE|nr:hypothetical protein AVEN_68709-1 [Araneus ventricosus]
MRCEYDGEPPHFRWMSEMPSIAFQGLWIVRRGANAWPTKLFSFSSLDYKIVQFLQLGRVLWSHKKSLICESPIYSYECLLAKIAISGLLGEVLMLDLQNCSVSLAWTCSYGVRLGRYLPVES